MKIAICGSVGLPARYGGWETLVEQLSTRLSRSCFKVIVYCSKFSYKEYPKSIEAIDLHYIPLRANGVQSILYDLASILHAMFVRRAQVILILGVSVGIFAPFINSVNIFGSKFVINVDGIEWKRRKWGRFTRNFLRLSESISVRYFRAVVADNSLISEYIRKEYGIVCPVITYGSDHTSREAVNPSILKKYPFLSSSFFLTICRIVPENNIGLICEAALKSELITVILGNWDSSKYGKSIRDKYSATQNLVLLDQNYNLKELNILRSHCRAYIHGHECGGTNPSLVEAMAFGCPLFCFDVGFNRCTTENQARYFDDVKSLIELMKNVHDFDGDISGLLMTCKNKYRWDHIVELYYELFLDLSK